MSRKLIVRELATESALDVDEVLVRLWDAGIEEVDSPESVVQSRLTNRARRALSLPTPKEMLRPGFWRDALQLSDADFLELLATLKIQWHSKLRRLPKGAVAKLRSHARARGHFRVGVVRELAVSERATLPEADWVPTLGHAVSVRCLRLEQILTIHQELVSDFQTNHDPIVPSGPRPGGMLESAIGRPQTSLGDRDKYPTVELACAAFFHSMVQNHPFHNGNKRTAIVSMLAFLDENGMMLTCDEDALFRIVVQTAQHTLVKSRFRNQADAEVMELARWLVQNTRWIEKGDRTVQWRRLRAILVGFGCRLDFPSGSGNRINIYRDVRQKLFLIPYGKTLHIQVAYPDDGRDAEKNTVASIRKELQLDENNGIDSAAFYDAHSWAPGDFIVKYRKTLRRLSRL